MSVDNTASTQGSGRQLRIRFFGALREVVGTDLLQIPAPIDEHNVPVETIGLAELHSLLAQHLNPDALADITAENVRIAVDQAFIDSATAIPLSAEIAFLPPVTGG